MQTNPGCVAVILTSRQEIILQHRDDKPEICWPGYWSLPGGGAEPGETPMDTVLREIKEETGVVPDEIAEVPVTPYEPAKNPPHVFLGSWDGAEQDLVLGEGQALRLFPMSQLPQKMPPHIRHYIDQLIRGVTES
ncbi:putative 8-oxo-dGTP diphosphatase [Streptomyces aurantiacus JA 4570]|uniref:Putative 8-oxo-dGTP diphosphatase n=1 Tax=Streptomyces aurantiacus JA 4570 TaxID=1286094 RepID=S3ZTF0_9ACTN|nr:putative 8-oxo-dGTP diphosphatase [Streptomyces aurantiacus JA 4570]